MRWDDLKVFLAVVRAQSLSGAGRTLRLDPATVGRRIARLEARLGQTLFLKSPQGYLPTEAAERLADEAVKAEQAVLGALDAVRGEGPGLTGTIRIGAPDGCANYVLPQVIARIAAENPGLDVQIVALPRVFNLSRREADMAIGVSRPEAGRLTVQKLSDYRLHFAAAADYLAAAPPLETPGDLGRHRIVGYIPDMIFDRELDYLPDLGVDHVELSSNAASVQLNLVRAGGGVGIVHDFAVPFAPGVRRVLVERVSLRRSFYLIRHADDARSERLGRFVARLRSLFIAEINRLEALA
ncbi:MAG: LysR family transcriptional regulator [Alphaproteobacteria bacterium]|nr:MAG: LysR family transcriptional regulator [Alphaproteobacteria bacterium]